jgi:TatD DNase family protein
LIIDSHCHLADEVFGTDLADVVSRAQAAGVDAALCILSADEPEELARAAAVTAVWPSVRFSAAIHPHHAGLFGPASGRDPLETVRQAVADAAAVAVGEIGLDYHYDFSPRDVQRQVFETQAAFAVSAGLPVIIHTREAFDDTVVVLQEQRVSRGVMHCFSGTKDEARRSLDLGFHVSLSGILTFPKAGDLRDVAAFVPEDRLLVETDAPYLAPVPHRGKRNEPGWVVKTLEALAACRGVDVHALAARLRENFEELFGVPRGGGAVAR